METAEREGRFETEGWRVRKDGTRFWASVVIDAIRDPSGTLVGFAKVTRDLTERKAAQEELRRSEERFRGWRLLPFVAHIAALAVATARVLNIAETQPH